MGQILCVLFIFMVLLLPMGEYVYRVATQKKTFMDPICDKIDGLIYRICGIKKDGMSFKHYITSLILTNGVMVLAAYILLRLQGILFLNPNKVSNMEPGLAFNTVISFMTNTNLQHYAGESMLSYWSQMVVIIFMMFMAAATGYSVCIAFIRGLVGEDKTLGNFYVDMVRVSTRILLPLSILLSLFLVSQGVPQTIEPHIVVKTIEGGTQNLTVGPIAALESIKHLGTNGGGFLSANSASPFENPTVLTNIIEILSMMLLPASMVIVFGKMVAEKRKVKSHKKRKFIEAEGRTLFIAMALLFVVGLWICFASEKAGNPLLQQAGLSQQTGSMEGKEMRFGIAQSSLFTTVTTAFTTGSVNNMHDTLTPLGGAVALMNMMLNVVFGGKGVGMMNMVIYAILTVFICGLMIGRTPEYLGKKIDSKEMKLTALCIIIHPLLILGFTAVALSVQQGLGGISNPGFHGLSQVLYEYTSSAANNGSGFEGLKDNTLFWNMTTGLAMFCGRYIVMIMQLAIASSLMMKQRVNESSGTLKTTTTTFTVALIVVVLIFAALTFFPVMTLGPIAEHLTLWH
ncbi:MAG: potassium-transporting ATPase subunit KdpA [Cellulosilyticaceae bacterium]